MQTSLEQNEAPKQIDISTKGIVGGWNLLSNKKTKKLEQMRVKDMRKIIHKRLT